MKNPLNKSSIGASMTGGSPINDKGFENRLAT